MPAQSNSNKRKALRSSQRSTPRGKGTATIAHAAPPPVPLAPDGRCQFLRADGKRCADAVYPGHDSLCHLHLLRQIGGIAKGNLIAGDILASVGNFQSASAINVALGKLLVHQIMGHISRRDALSIAYTFQLLLQTLPAVKAELSDCGYSKYWLEETSRILARPADLDALTDKALLPNGFHSLHPPAVARVSAPQPTAAPPPSPAPSPNMTLPPSTSSPALAPSTATPTAPQSPAPPAAGQPRTAPPASTATSSATSSATSPISSIANSKFAPPAIADVPNPPFNYWKSLESKNSQ